MLPKRAHKVPYQQEESVPPTKTTYTTVTSFIAVTDYMDGFLISLCHINLSLGSGFIVKNRKTCSKHPEMEHWLVPKGVTGQGLDTRLR